MNYNKGIKMKIKLYTKFVPASETEFVSVRPHYITRLYEHGYEHGIGGCDVTGKPASTPEQAKKNAIERYNEYQDWNPPIPELEIIEDKTVINF